MNQGTLVVFKRDPSLTNDDLYVIFGAYGEIKEVILIFLFIFFSYQNVWKKTNFHVKCFFFFLTENQIRETPHKSHHKFVEFYDVRAAEAALKALNRCEIAGKRIKVEPSRPGGARRRFVSFFL